MFSHSFTRLKCNQENRHVYIIILFAYRISLLSSSTLWTFISVRKKIIEINSFEIQFYTKHNTVAGVNKCNPLFGNVSWKKGKDIKSIYLT